MIGLETYLDHLPNRLKKSFDSRQAFQIWMEGKGFHRDVGGTHGGSSIMRKLERHAGGRPYAQTILVIGPAGGEPSTIVTLRAVVSRVVERGGGTSYKPVHGTGWLAKHIILARHVRLVMSVRAAKAHRRGRAEVPQAQAEVDDMLANLDNMDLDGLDAT